MLMEELMGVAEQSSRMQVEPANCSIETPELRGRIASKSSSGVPSGAPK